MSQLLLRTAFLSSGFVVNLILLPASSNAEEIIAKVNGKSVSSEVVHLQFFLKQIPDASQAEQRQQLTNNLIDRELLRQFLQKRRVKADKYKLEHQLTLVRKVIEKNGDSLEEIFEKLGLTENALEDFLSLNLAWEAYAAKQISEQSIQEHFEEHRKQLDGTRVEAAQIVRVVKNDATEQEWAEAEKLLSEVRKQIESKEISFADAARKHSQSPSKQQGGDLGKFEYSGRVSKSVAKAAFALKPRELSQPTRSPFGVHLIQVKSIIPGQLSAEDARPEIIELLSQQLWDETVKSERSRARIQLLDTPQ